MGLILLTSCFAAGCAPVYHKCTNPWLTAVENVPVKKRMAESMQSTSVAELGYARLSTSGTE